MKFFVLLLAFTLSLVSVPVSQAQRTTPPLLEAVKQVHLNHLYAFDSKPLGDRIPLVILPGRAQEAQRNPWWRKFETRWKLQADLEARYKLYIFMYDSTQKLEIPTDEFRQDFHHFVEMLGQDHHKAVL